MEGTPEQRSSPQQTGELSDRDRLLKAAMRPIVQSSVVEVFESQSQRMVDSLYPLIGRVVRRSVRESLKALAQSIDTTMRDALTLKQVRWRLEAKRQGIPVAELVLRKSLLFRVEEVFLIHQHTGLLVSHVGLRSEEDRDLVSGMFTAIQDFVADSFSGGEGGKDAEEQLLDRFQVGDHDVWLFHGPHAYMAVVISGTAPASYRDQFDNTLEEIHGRFGRELETFEGDDRGVKDIGLLLEDCLIERQKQVQSGKKPLLFFILLALALLLFAWGSWRWFGNRRDHDRIAARLAEIPGVIILDSAAGWRDPRFEVLADPVAGDLTAAAKEAVPSGAFEIQVAPFQSADPQVMALRAEDRLSAFTTAEDAPAIQVRDGVLVLGGSATNRWIEQMHEAVPHLGVTHVDDSGLVNSDLEACRELAERVASLRIGFLPGQVRTGSDAGGKWQRLAQGIRGLNDLARQAGLSHELRLYTGRGADLGEAEQRLANARNQVARTALLEMGISGDDLEAKGWLPERFAELGVAKDESVVISSFLSLPTDK